MVLCQNNTLSSIRLCEICLYLWSRGMATIHLLWTYNSFSEAT